MDWTRKVNPVIAFDEWIFRERLDEAKNFLRLRSAFRHDCEQFKVQINGVARHEVSFGSNVAQIHRA